MYDGNPSLVGTIRIKWSYAKPQDMTVAGELVEPGRAHMGSYGTKLHRIIEGCTLSILEMPKQIAKELLEGEETPASAKQTRTSSQNHTELHSLSSLHRESFASLQ